MISNAIARRLLRVVAEAVAGIFLATASGAFLFVYLAHPSVGSRGMAGIPSSVSSFLQAYAVSSAVAGVIALILGAPVLTYCARRNVDSGLRWVACIVLGALCGFLGWALEAAGVNGLGLLWLIFLVPGVWVGVIAYPLARLATRVPGKTVMVTAGALAIVAMLGFVLLFTS